MLIIAEQYICTPKPHYNTSAGAHTKVLTDQQAFHRTGKNESMSFSQRQASASLCENDTDLGKYMIFSRTIQPYFYVKMQICNPWNSQIIIESMFDNKNSAEAVSRLPCTMSQNRS